MIFEIFSKQVGVSEPCFSVLFLFWQGLAITFVSDENDAKILNEVQNRFDVNITELPDEIDLSSYSK